MASMSKKAELYINRQTARRVIKLACAQIEKLGEKAQDEKGEKSIISALENVGGSLIGD